MHLVGKMSIDVVENSAFFIFVKEYLWGFFFVSHPVCLLFFEITGVSHKVKAVSVSIVKVRRSNFLLTTRFKIRGAFDGRKNEKMTNFQLLSTSHIYTFSYSEFYGEFEYAIFNTNWSWEIFFNGISEEKQVKWGPDFGFFDVKKKS